jgi:hemoglobin
LYEKLGEKAAVEIAVDNFYERVLIDERIKHFFANVDMKKQRGH